MTCHCGRPLYHKGGGLDYCEGCDVLEGGCKCPPAEEETD